MTKRKDHLRPFEHERDLAWALLSSSKAREVFDAHHCQPKHVNDEALRDLILTVMDLHTSGIEVTEPTLLDRGANIERVRSLHNEHSDVRPDHFNVDHLAASVHTAAVGRALEQMAVQLQYSLNRGDRPHELLSEAQDLLGSIEQHAPVNSPGEAKAKAAEEVMQRLDEGEQSYMSTGIGPLTKMLQLEGSRLCVLAARPGMGKSVLAENVALYQALHCQGRVAFFSYEMSTRQLLARAVAWDTEIALRPTRDDHWTVTTYERHKHRQKVLESLERLKASSLFFIEGWADNTIESLRSRCRRMKRSGGLDLVVVDYIQLMDCAKPSENVAVNVGRISKGLKLCANELDIPVIALSQLNRSVETRKNKRPLMSDLRESGAIEQDADTIAFLYSEEYYALQERQAVPADKANVVEVNIAKQRDGETGHVDLSFCKPLSKFGGRNKYAVKTDEGATKR